VLNFIF